MKKSSFTEGADREDPAGDGDQLQVALHAASALGTLRDPWAPTLLRSDNGSEFISRSLAVFLSQRGTQSRFIKPESPWQNAFTERFNSTLRRDCLDVEEFYTLADAQVKLRLLKQRGNLIRHSATVHQRSLCHHQQQETTINLSSAMGAG